MKFEEKMEDKGLKLPNYQTWVFDCDGVLLDSNRIKTDAFYQVAKPYGDDKAQALVEHHVRNGGISRYVKFHHFLADIVGRIRVNDHELDSLLESYALRVREGLMQCEVAGRLDHLRALTSASTWMIVSGGDQEEIRWVFRERGLADLFNGGIYGSPDTKDEILSRSLRDRIVVFPAVFLGDSQYDIEAATRAGLDFIFLSGWSESNFDFAHATFRFESISAIAGSASLESL